jgi:hypothetical protein
MAMPIGEDHDDYVKENEVVKKEMIEVVAYRQ